MRALGPVRGLKIFAVPGPSHSWIVQLFRPHPGPVQDFSNIFALVWSEQIDLVHGPWIPDKMNLKLVIELGLVLERPPYTVLGWHVLNC